MAVPFYGHARPVIIVGPLGAPVVIVQDTDDDAIALAQTTALTIVENYAYDEASMLWQRMSMYGPTAFMSDLDTHFLLTRAQVAGYDYSQAANLTLVGIASRRVDATPADERYQALFVNSHTRGFDVSAAAGSRSVLIQARLAGTSPLDERYYGLYSLAHVRGLDANAVAGAQSSAILAVNQLSVSASLAEAMAGLLVCQARESGFAAARKGRRFYTTNQTPGTLTTAQVAFVATTPTLMLRINSAAIRAIPRSLDLCLANTPGGLVYVTVCLDTADRYSAAGTAVVPQNTNEESATAPVSLFYENPTAGAAGAGTRYLGTWIMPAVPGSMLSLRFDDEILQGPTASTFLVYIWAPTTAPQITYALDHEEVA
jgi:hypothetical protein